MRITSAPSPTATTSGLIRVISRVADRRKWRQHRLFVDSAYRQHIISISGGVIFSQDPIPELPALHTSTIPLSLYARLDATSRHDVRPNHDICNFSICHRTHNTPKSIKHQLHTVGKPYGGSPITCSTRCSETSSSLRSSKEASVQYCHNSRLIHSYAGKHTQSMTACRK